jgi:hypothetical protein
VLAKQGVTVVVSDLFGVGGQQLLDRLELDPPYAARVTSLRRLIDALDFEIDTRDPADQRRVGGASGLPGGAGRRWGRPGPGRGVRGRDR